MQSPIVLSSQVNKRNQDANQPPNFLNNLPLSEPRAINRKHANYLTDIPLLPQSSIALIQEESRRKSHIQKQFIGEKYQQLFL